MQVSAREASEILAAAGLSRQQARRVLAAGLAGPGLKTRSATLYDEASVRDLLSRPCLGAIDLDPACREEMFVARVSPAAAAGGQEAVRSGWRLSPYARLRIRVRVDRDGFMPFVATVCGFVVLGANLVDARPDQRPDVEANSTDERTVLDVEPPGAWFDTFRASRFVTGPGSPWTLWSAARGHRTW